MKPTDIDHNHNTYWIKVSIAGMLAFVLQGACQESRYAANGGGYRLLTNEGQESNQHPVINQKTRSSIEAWYKDRKLGEITKELIHAIGEKKEIAYINAMEQIMKLEDFQACLNILIYKYGDTPLSKAISINSESSVELLLKKGADPSGIDLSGNPHLLLAIPDNNFNMVKLLVNEGGADVNEENEITGRTPLMQAIENNSSIEIVKFLVLKGADIGMGMAKGFGYSCKGKNGLSKAKPGDNTIMLALRKAKSSEEAMKIAEFLIETLIEKYNNDELQKDKLKTIITQGNRQANKSVLDLANKYKYENILSYLKKHTPDIYRLWITNRNPAINQETQLSRIKAWYNNEDLAQITKGLINAMYINKEKTVAYISDMQKAMDSDIKKFQDCLSMPISEYRDTSPISQAISTSSEELVELFIDKGVDLSRRDLSGDSALMLAILYNNFNMVNWLVNKGGADVNEENEITGRTPLMQAIENNSSIKIVQLLVNKGADIGMGMAKGFGYSSNSKGHFRKAKPGDSTIMVALRKAKSSKEAMKIAEFLIETLIEKYNNDELETIITQRNIQTNESVLALAYKGGYQDITLNLINHITDKDQLWITDREEKSLAYRAACCNDKQVFETLLNRTWKLSDGKKEYLIDKLFAKATNGCSIIGATYLPRHTFITVITDIIWFKGKKGTEEDKDMFTKLLAILDNLVLKAELKAGIRADISNNLEKNKISQAYAKELSAEIDKQLV